MPCWMTVGLIMPFTLSWSYPYPTFKKPYIDKYLNSTRIYLRLAWPSYCYAIDTRYQNRMILTGEPLDRGRLIDIDIDIDIDMTLTLTLTWEWHWQDSRKPQLDREGTRPWQWHNQFFILPQLDRGHDLNITKGLPLTLTQHGGIDMNMVMTYSSLIGV